MERHEQHDRNEIHEQTEQNEIHDFYKHEIYEQLHFGMDFDGIPQTSIYLIHDLT